MSSKVQMGNVLAPIAGIHFFPSQTKSEMDTFSNRWNRHFHTLYGMNISQSRDDSFNLQNLVIMLSHTPYWDITSNEDFRKNGRLTQRNPQAILGLLDHLNLFQTLSICFMASVIKMHRAANRKLATRDWNSLYKKTSSSLDHSTASSSQEKSAVLWQRRLSGYGLKMSAYAMTLLLHWPTTLIATLTTHLFDLAKRFVAIVIATVTASATQLSAEIGYHGFKAVSRSPSQLIRFALSK